MSVQALAWVLQHSPSQGTDRLVLIALANHAHLAADGAWETRASVHTVAADARVDDPAAVLDALQRLVDTGELDRIHDGGPGPLYRIRRASKDGRS